MSLKLSNTHKQEYDFSFVGHKGPITYFYTYDKYKGNFIAILKNPNYYFPYQI